MAYRDGWFNPDARNPSRKKHWFRSGTSLCRKIGGCNGIHQEVPRLPGPGITTQYCKACVEKLIAAIQDGYVFSKPRTESPNADAGGQ